MAVARENLTKLLEELDPVLCPMAQLGITVKLNINIDVSEPDPPTGRSRGGLAEDVETDPPDTGGWFDANTGEWIEEHGNNATADENVGIGDGS